MILRFLQFKNQQEFISLNDEPICFRFIQMNKQQIFVLAILICLANSLNIGPLPTLTKQSLQKHLKCDLQTFLTNGTSTKTNFFLLFKIPSCQHCQQAEVFFHNLYIEYTRRFHSEPQRSRKELESNFIFAQIDCNQSSVVCDRFSIPHYPYYLVFEPSGEACSYEGGPLPGNMIAYLQQRKLGNKYEQCKNIGRFTLSRKLLGFFEPITNLFSQNVVLFIVAFLIGPFLFGYVFSRMKKNKEEVLNSLKQSKSE